MRPTTFAYRLNLCLDKEKFPPKNRGRIQLLAEMVGLTHRGASKWINGESEPPAKKIPHLANKLNVSETWLRTGEGNMIKDNGDHQNQNILTIDVPIYKMETFLSENRMVEKKLTCNLSYYGEFFGIKLDTEAMSPRFPKGSIIIFDETKEIKDGDFVFVDYPSLPGPIFRQLLIIGDTFYLNAHNPKFDRLILNEPQRIIGKLIQAILSFE